MNKKAPRDQLAYSLHRLTFILQHISEDLLQEKLGIGFSQFKLMIGMAKHPGDDQQHLAKYLGQTEASISRQIKLMKDMGLVKIEKDKKDSRRRHLYLTTKGYNHFEKAQKLLEQKHREVLHGLSDSDIKKFNKYLDSMLSAVGCDLDFIRH